MYTLEKVPASGEVTIPYKYHNGQDVLPAVVVKTPDPNLLVRDWLQEIKLNWNSLFNIHDSNPQPKTILHTHDAVFEEGLSTTPAKIYLDRSVTPKFLKARPVPYAS